MFMRFRGGGVGHFEYRTATNVFLTDRDPLDKKRVDEEREGAEQEEDDGTGLDLVPDSDDEVSPNVSDGSDNSERDSDRGDDSDLGPEDGENEDEGLEFDHNT